MPALKSDPRQPDLFNRKQKTENRKLYVGPAGWDYPDWQGVVYPPAVKGTGRLAFLAELFDVVEINVTFYRPLTVKIAAKWLEALKDHPDFRFTAKLWQVFTHERRLAAPELALFREGLEPLLAAGRLGVLLAQFPYAFHNSEENREYLLKLKAALPDWPLAVEVRHRSWQHEEVREFLQEAGLDFVNIDQPLVSYPMGATRWVTGSRGYLRCHGQRQDTWFEFGEDRGARYDYFYGPEELGDLAERTRKLLEKAKEVYVIFNNHPAGQAVANGLELLHLLQPEHRPALPPGLLAVFPRLAKLVEEYLISHAKTPRRQG
jgi:uncharacterized protein YecE (DUF72 family)